MDNVKKDTNNEGKERNDKLNNKRKIDNEDIKIKKSKKEVKEDDHNREDDDSNPDNDNEEEEEEEEGDDADDNESSVVEDENEYQYDDFVVPEGEGDDKNDDDDDDESNGKLESDDEDDNDEIVHRKPKKKSLNRLKKRADVALDVEDLELLEDNAMAFGSRGNMARHHKRSENRSNDDENDIIDDEDDNDNENEIVPDRRSKNLDDGDDVEDEDEDDDDNGASDHAVNRNNRRPDYNDDDGSDLGDFLVDEMPLEGDYDERDGGNDGYGADGTKSSTSRTVPRRPLHHRRDGPTFDQIKDATDIFGDGFDDFDDEMLYDENDEAEGLNRDKVRGHADLTEQAAREKLREKYDRSILVENFCTERDDTIRDEDRPERYQDILFNRVIPDESERELEAAWMSEKLVHLIMSDEQVENLTKNQHQSNSNSIHSVFHRNAELQKSLIEPIQNVLRYIQIEQLEPPFIWLYRRDYLSMRMRRKDLWKILAWDEQWERLYSMKQRIFELLKALRESAESRLIDKEAAMQEELDNSRQLKDCLASCRFTQTQLDLAESEHQELLDIVDMRVNNDTEIDDDTHKVRLKFDEITALKQTLKVQESRYQDIKKVISNKRLTKVYQDQFKPELAVEVLRLFPEEKYTYLINQAKTEVEVKDIADFLSSFAKCAVNKKSSASGAHKKHSIIMDAKDQETSLIVVSQESQQSQESQDSVISSGNGGMEMELENSVSITAAASVTTTALTATDDDEDDDGMKAMSPTKGSPSKVSPSKVSSSPDKSPKDSVLVKASKKSTLNSSLFDDDDDDDEDKDLDDDSNEDDHDENEDENDDDDDDNINNKDYKRRQNIDDKNDAKVDIDPAEDEEEEDEDFETIQQIKAKFQKLASSHYNIPYQKYKHNPKLREFIEMFTIPACEYGDSLAHSYKIEPPPTCEFTPEVLAESYLDENIGLKSKEMVRRVVTNIVAIEYAQEPNTRKLAREVFIKDGSISTRPTKKGLLAITANSELFGLHYLERKPIRDFLYGYKDKTLFARLFDAERNDLITITIHPPRSNNVNNQSVLPEANKTIFSDSIELFMREYKFIHPLIPSVPPQQDKFSHSRVKWDELRFITLNLMLEKYLFPSILKETRRELLKSSREAIVAETGANFQQILQLNGPLPHPVIDNTREYWKNKLRDTPKESTYHTVMGVYIVSSDHEPICCCYLDSDGVLKAHVLIPDRLTPLNVNNKLKDFILNNRPEIIVINASGGNQAKNIARIIESVLLPEITEMVENEIKERSEFRKSSNYNDDDDEDEDDDKEGGRGVYKPSVAIIKDDLASIFKRSPRSKKMFPDLQPGTCAAVSLGRYAQEPLMEYCSLWTSADAVEMFGYESLYLDLHPLKDLIKGVKLPIMRALERCLVDAVCDVGVDINRAVTHDHLAPMLAFVCGLGLRKADHLRRKINSSIKFVDSRKIILEKKLLSVNTWTNACGFLKVCDDLNNDALNEESYVFDPLDNTRIHPECYVTYQCAQKICCDALEVDTNPLNFRLHVLKQMESSKKDLEARMRHPEWIDLWERGTRPQGEYEQYVAYKDGKSEWKQVSVELDDAMSLLILDEYANEIESTQGKRKLQLEHIKEELRYPWLDLRRPMNKLTDKDLFSIITGESDQTLYVGLKIGCQVLDVKDHFNQSSGRRFQTAFVRTDSGLKGSISGYEVLDERIDEERFNLQDHLQVGMRMVGVVIGVNKVKGTVDISVKPSYLRVNESWWIANRSTDKNASKWYSEQGKVPGELYDRYFLEREALEELARVEAPITNGEGHTDDEHEAYSEHSRFSQPSSQNTLTSSTANKQKVVQLSMRQVHHPLFANCGYKEAEARLTREGKGAGEVIIRPSSKGPNMLGITWAFQANEYVHVEVEEINKKEGNLGLGNQLVIREPDMEHEIFSDLDEIYARYIEPMNDLVSAMVTHRSFRAGTVAEVEQSLFDETISNPDRNPYCIRFDPNHIGSFMLTWVIKTSSKPVKTERILVRPQGYKIKNELFARPSDLILWFKKAASNAAEKQQQQSRLQSSAATAAAAANQAEVQKMFQSFTHTVNARQQSQVQQPEQMQRKSRLFSGATGTAAASMGGGVPMPMGGQTPYIVPGTPGYPPGYSQPPPMYGGPPPSMTPNAYMQQQQYPPMHMGGGQTPYIVPGTPGAMSMMPGVMPPRGVYGQQPLSYTGAPPPSQPLPPYQPR